MGYTTGTGLYNSWYRGFGIRLQRGCEYSFAIIYFNTEKGWLPLWLYYSYRLALWEANSRFEIKGSALWVFGILFQSLTCLLLFVNTRIPCLTLQGFCDSQYICPDTKQILNKSWLFFILRFLSCYIRCSWSVAATESVNPNSTQNPDCLNSTLNYHKNPTAWN